MAEHEAKQIVRRWNWEIEAELRRDEKHDAERGPWKAVVWAVLWIFWLLLLAALLTHLKALG